jgi:hypothetical protein
MIPAFSSSKKIKFVKKKFLEEAEKCLKVILLLAGHEETNKTKSELLQQLGTNQQLRYLSWNR